MKKRMLSLGLVLMSTSVFALALPPSASAAGGTATLLTVPLYAQEQSNWCWAASVQMMQQTLRGVHDSQCQIVKWGKASTSCSNVVGTDAEARKAMTSALLTSVVYGNSLPPYSVIKTEITAGRPVLYHLQWSTSGSHFVVVTGIFSDPGATTTGVYWNNPLPVNQGTKYSGDWGYLNSNTQWKAQSSVYQIKKA